MPAAKTPKLELVDIDSLVAHEANPNQGDVGAICDLIVHNGWFGQTLVQARDDQPDRIFVGEHRWRALRLLQSQGGVVRENGTDTPLDYPALQARAEALDLPALPPAGKCWVQRYAISDRLARRHMLADNRAHDLASYDDQQLAQILREIADEDGLVGTGFDDEALDELLRDLAADEAKNRPKVSDEAPPVPETPVTQLGDLIVLGEHRLLCGDSRDPDSFARLLGDERADMVWTDPPYGMALETDFGAMHTLTTEPGNHAKGNYAPVVGDDEPFDARPFLDLFAEVKEQFWWGADYYRATIEEGGSWVVWDKRWDDGMEAKLDAAIGSQFELCWTRQAHRREIARVLWSGHHGLQREDTKSRVHPTQKPIALAAWFFDRWGAQGEIVLDPFAGSGTTLMACEQEGRRARCIEIDPGYCDVIIARYEKHTGRQAERP